MSKYHVRMSVALIVLGLVAAVGCSTAPKSEEKKDELHSAVDQTMKRINELDPSLNKKMKDAYAYAIFPTVGKGGLIVGGAYGRGEVYQGGNMIGWADISQATIGAQAGGHRRQASGWRLEGRPGGHYTRLSC